MKKALIFINFGFLFGKVLSGIIFYGVFLYHKHERPYPNITL